MVTKLDKSILYLGYDWLFGANPKIDWRMLLIARIVPNETLNYLEEFADIFSDTRVKSLPLHQVWDHCINLTLDKVPRWKVYPMSKKETKVLNSFLEEGLQTGKLWKSKSPYASLFFFRWKHRTDELQGIQDYWFNLVRMRRGDEEKAAFIICQGLYELLVMQFRLCNMPPTFQRMIDDVLAEELSTK